MRGQSVWGVARGALMASACALALMASGAQARDDVQRFDIAAQPLSGALTALGEQAGVAVFAPAGLVAGRRAAALSGDFTPMAALDRLLEGSGLRARRDASGAIVVEAVPADDGDEARRDAAPAREQAAGEVVLEQMVVTGTNIRGVQSASPLLSFDRRAIEATGLSSVPDFVRQIPQNFGGGVSDSNLGVVPGSPLNATQGVGVNLRGLGNDSTLVLLNGARVAAAGDGNFVDISMIPLSAVERIDVLPDGASAIYGSDAVGGVVNFILREDYQGAETRLRYGTATSGDLDDLQIGQTFGTAWTTGNVLLAYEFQQRDDLETEDRGVTRDTTAAVVIVPQQTRHSVVARARQELTFGADLFANAFYSDRRSELATVDPASQSDDVFDTVNEQLGFTVGADVTVTDRMAAVFSATYSANETNASRVITGTDDFRDFGTRENKAWYIDAKLDGAAFDLPGGSVRFAAGLQYRNEQFDSTFDDPAVPFVDQSLGRDVIAAFGELYVPVFGQRNRLPGIDSLEMTIAVRHEDYSDYGSTTDPKIGVLWSPGGGVSFRGTWGTSFRAPLFSEQLVENSSSSFLVLAADPQSATGTSLAVFAQGSGNALGPETATTWTVGVDYAPASLPGLTVQATYFNIDFTDRIAAPGVRFGSFTDPRWPAEVVVRDPDPAVLSRLGSIPFATNLAGPSFAFQDAELLIDNRLRNLASVELAGLDFSVRYSYQSGVGLFDFSVGATYLLEQNERVLPTDAPVDVLNTVYNPAAFKMNGALGWALDGYSANVVFRHVNSYHDVRFEPAAKVEAWNTVDVNIGYRFSGTGNGLLNDTRLSLIGLNVFDEDPPFILDDFASINYDPTNANAFGRTIAVQIVKAW